MYMRLAFAVATEVEPDIQLLDEILSVGDIATSSKSAWNAEALSRCGQDDSVCHPLA